MPHENFHFNLLDEPVGLRSFVQSVWAIVSVALFPGVREGGGWTSIPVRGAPTRSGSRSNHSSQRDLQYSSSPWASSNTAVLLPGTALRTAPVRCEGLRFNMLRKPRERTAPSHPLPWPLQECAGRGSARSWPRSRRGPAQDRPRRTGGRAPDSVFGARVPQREQSCDVPAGGTSTKGMPALALRNVEELPPTLLGDGPVQATLVRSPAKQAGDLQRLYRIELGALHRMIREAMEFLPSRLRLSFTVPAQAPPSSWRGSSKSRLPRDTARCFRRSALRTAGFRRRSTTSAVGKGGKAPDASPTGGSGSSVPSAGRTCSNRSGTSTRRALRTTRKPGSRSGGGRGRRIANRLRGRPFLRNSPRRPSSRIRSAHRADFGSSTRNERHPLRARKHGNPGFLPDLTRESEPLHRPVQANRRAPPATGIPATRDPVSGSRSAS